jgi:hypothetical protein
MSTLFYNTRNPHEETAEARVFSVAMHAACCIAAAGLEWQSGPIDDAVILAAWSRLARQVLQLYPVQFNCISEVVDVAKRHGHNINVELDPELREAVIQ